jgi:uncharacterized protein YndB with AHSA1/START domain
MPEITARAERTIAAPPEEIWEALTDPAKLKAYFMGADFESDWKVGSPIRIKGEFKGEAYEDKGEIRSFEPARRLAYSHYSPLSGAADAPENYHLVTFELQPQGEATKVILTQANLLGGVKPSDEKMRGEYEKTWNTVLDGLARTVEH